MNDALLSLLYVPLMAISILFVDETARIWLGQDLAAAASTRGARAALASIGPDGRADPDIETRVRSAAAVALLPDTRGDDPRGGADPAVADACARLARQLDLDLPSPAAAESRLEVEVSVVEGGRVRPLHAGDSTAGADAVQVDLTWHHPLRTSPAAPLLDDGDGPGWSHAVRASGRLAVDHR